MKKILPLFLFIPLQFLNAQDIDWQHYQTLQSSGEVPEDFTKLSSEKFEAEKKNIDINAGRETKKNQEQFYLKSNFIMDELLHSGRVCFGDPITVYLNKIKDELLKDDPKLKNEIRIYTFRSTSVNAFTTNNGMVLVTTGLIAQAENEAQIAFILSHEFNHYIKKHALNEYVENKAMMKGRGIYRNLNPNDIELRAFSYSKELESEADQLGLQLYRKSNYSLDEAEKVFDVLLYSYLPFDEVEFRRDYFNEGSYQVPADYFLDSVNAITAVDNYDDEKNTHPNIKKRRTAIMDAVKDENDKGRQLSIVSESTFKKNRLMCRYENCLLNLNNCEFEEAFYNSYLLLQDDPNNIFLKKIMTRALYGASMYKNYSHSIDHRVYYKDIEGESEQVYYMIDKMPKKDFNILALKFAYSTLIADEKDETINKICKELTFQLVKEEELDISDFRDSYPGVAPDTILNKSKDQKSKVEKIKSLESNKNSDNAYWKFAFVNYMKDENFKNLFTEAKIENNKQSAASTAVKKKDKHEEFALGIDRAVIVNPLYLKIDETSKNPVKYEAAENLKLDLQNKISSCADAAGIQIDYLESKKLNHDNVEKFNDLAILNNWISEEFNHEKMPVINSNNEQMLDLIKKYNTDHFAWIGVVNFHEKKKYVALKLILSAIYFPVLPYTIAWAAKPKYDTVFFTMVANGKTGDFEMQYANTVKANDAASIQKSNIYYIFKQMKTQEKK